MLTVYNRPSRAWGTPDRTSRRCKCPVWVEGTVLGDYVRRSLKTGSFERGMRIARQMEDSGKVEKKEEVTVPHACQVFLKEIEQRNLNWSTAKKYKLLLTRLEAHAESRHVSLLRKVD